MGLTKLAQSLDFVQDTTPSSPKDGDIWLDTSLSSPQMKVYDDSSESFVQPRSIENLDSKVSDAGASQTDIKTAVDNSTTGSAVSTNLDAKVSQAGAGAAVKKLDLRFVREMSRLFFDRSLSDLNFTDGTFEVFTDLLDITQGGGVTVTPGGQGRATIAETAVLSEAEFAGVFKGGNATRYDLEFVNNGNRAYLTDDNSIREFKLDIPFDLETASPTGASASPSDTQLRGVTVSRDGTKMIVAGDGNDNLYEFAFGSPYELATASTTGTTVDLSRNFGEAERPTGVVSNDDGSKVYVASAQEDRVTVYGLSTPFDLSTASTTGNNFAPSEVTTPEALAFTADGEKFVVLNRGDASLKEYTLSTPFDLTTATFQNNSLGYRGTERGVELSDAGDKVYRVDSGVNGVDTLAGALLGKSGTGTIDKQVNLSFTPASVVIEQSTSGQMSVSYDITDSNGNTVSVAAADVGTTVDTSALANGDLTLTAALDSSGSNNELSDFAAYFD